MKRIIFCVLFLTTVFPALAQVQVTLGPDEIAENQGWTIVVTIQDERLKSYDNFPEIPGFKKRGTSTQSNTTIVNGKISSSQSVIMNYSPTQQGVVTVPSFTITVNDKPVKVTGKKVTVGPAKQQQSSDPFKSFFDRSPADDFFGRGETEFVDVEDDAFLSLSTNKTEVYVGEGFNATLSFFIAENNRAPLQWYDLNKQLTDILKRIKPATCWEENFDIESIEGERVRINGKDYLQYKIYQAMFYPLNSQTIQFPSVSLEMIKYKVAKNPSFFGQNSKEGFKTFKSKPKTITVKELPPHPLRNTVAVGDYKLNERIQDTHLQTGNSVSYEFNIYGEGNIASIGNPLIKNNGAFEVYDPNVSQQISKVKNRVTGTKSFRYFMIPKEPGQYNLGDFYQWIFFNPEKHKYDTLQATTTVNVEGESKKNEVIQSSDPGSFYNKISIADNSLRKRKEDSWHTWLFSGFLMLMVGGSAFLLFKK